MIAALVVLGRPPDDPLMRLLAEQLELRLLHRDEAESVPEPTPERRERLTALVAQAEEAIAAGDPESEVLQAWIDTLRSELHGVTS